MDKKNTIIGISLLITAFALMYFQPRPQPPAKPAPAIESPGDVSQPNSSAPANPSVPSPSNTAPASNGPATVESVADRDGEKLTTLENGRIRAVFTNYGGAIREIELLGIKRTIDSDEPYVMNHLRYSPALDLTTAYGNLRGIVFTEAPKIEDDTVVYRAKINDQLEVTRRYSISQTDTGAAPYTITHKTEFHNLSDQPLPIGEPSYNIGTVAPSGDQDTYLQTFGYFDGEDTEFIPQSKFIGGGFIFKSDPKPIIQESANMVWASVKNQFFITILTPETPGTGFAARSVEFPSIPGDSHLHRGLTADLRMPALTIPPSQTTSQSFSFYAGPKEHGRLAKLKESQEKAMEFGFFGFVSKPLLLLMNFINSVVSNWGLTIILLTIVVRSVLLPITLMSMKSMRKMSKMQEPMKLLKEKFPNDAQKQQVMMMELYKLNKVNPVAGCLPMLAQIPIFFGLFYMLRSAAELRFEDFLWIQDLSKADTVLTIPNVPFLGNLPLNLLPFAWLVTLAYQMWTMPTPTVDNAQAKLMKFMPFVFFPITYTFSSGLVLYWTVSNVFTIGQQWLAKRGETNFEVQLPPALKKAMEATPKSKRTKK